jgi:hypothetical protein
MGMQTDVLLTQPLGATAGNTFKTQGAEVLGPCRIKAIYGTSAAAAGTVVLYDGSSTAGKPIGTISTPTAASAGTYYLLLPGEGIRVDVGVYAVITNVDSAMLVYG